MDEKFSLHTEAMAWLRFGKQVPLLCTEAGRWNADVLGIRSDGLAIEVEIKRSLSDLRAEFRNKQNKHWHYANPGRKETLFGMDSDRWTPNYFYFYVPESLKEAAVKLAEEKAPYAGVAYLAFASRGAKSLGHSTYVAKKAKRIHDKEHPYLEEAVRFRMGSELCMLRATLELLKRNPEDYERIASIIAELMSRRDPELDTFSAEMKVDG